MANKCPICSDHKNRLEIDRQLVRGCKQSDIVREFGYHKDVVSRHFNLHITRQMAKSGEIVLKNQDRNILEEIDASIKLVKKILQKADAKEQDYKLLAAAKELRGQFELVSKIQYAIIEQQRKDQESGQGIQESQEPPDLSVLSKEESACYFALLEKILSGKEQKRIEGIKYDNSPSDGEIVEVSPVNGETKRNQPSVLDRIRERRSESNGTMKRTRFSEEDEDEDKAPTGVGPVIPKELSSESKNMSYKERKQYYGG